MSPTAVPFQKEPLLTPCVFRFHSGLFFLRESTTLLSGSVTWKPSEGMLHAALTPRSFSYCGKRLHHAILTLSSDLASNTQV